MLEPEDGVVLAATFVSGDGVGVASFEKPVEAERCPVFALWTNKMVTPRPKIKNRKAAAATYNQRRSFGLESDAVE